MQKERKRKYNESSRLTKNRTLIDDHLIETFVNNSKLILHAK